MHLMNGAGRMSGAVGGVVLRAANQESMIAGGNHTLIPMTPPYGAAFGGWNGRSAVPYEIGGGRFANRPCGEFGGCYEREMRFLHRREVCGQCR